MAFSLLLQIRRDGTNNGLICIAPYSTEYAYANISSPFSWYTQHTNSDELYETGCCMLLSVFVEYLFRY